MKCFWSSQNLLLQNLLLYDSINFKTLINNSIDVTIYQHLLYIKNYACNFLPILPIPLVSTLHPPPLNMISILVCIYIYCVHMFMNLQMMTILASDMTIWEHLSHEDEYINERGIRHYCTYMQYYNTTLNNKKIIIKMINKTKFKDK